MWVLNSVGPDLDLDCLFKLSEKVSLFHSFLASGDLCPLLITFANSLYPNQEPQNVSPDLDPNCLYKLSEKVR